MSDEKIPGGQEPEEELDSVVELIDEDGETVRFEHLMTVQYEGQDYVVLTYEEDTPDTEEGEVFILRIDTDEQGEDCYVSLEDDATEQAVFDRFMELVEEMEVEDAPDTDG